MGKIEPRKDQIVRSEKARIFRNRLAEAAARTAAAQQEQRCRKGKQLSEQGFFRVPDPVRTR